MKSYSLLPDGADILAANLTREQWNDIVYNWAAHARDDQLAPVIAKGGGRWHTWLVLGGRGSGKTRTGAEWIRAQVIGEPPLADRRSRRIALIGDTIAQVRSVMIEGVSGLLSVYPPEDRPMLEVSRNQLVWSNGTVAQMFAADNPDSLRGPQFDAAWCDELCKWRRPDTAWDTLQFAMRLGRWPQCVITTTPRPIPLLKKIRDDHATATTLSRTADNEKFLSPSFLAEMLRRYGDTLIGRQELDGEIVEERMTDLWKRSYIDQGRLAARPELTRIVVAVDPPVTSTAGSDSCGIVVAGLGVDRRAYVIGDRTVQGREPTVWAKAAVATYHDYEADTIVVETNQGGDLLVQMFKSIDARVPVKKVYASRGKYMRAEPVSTLYAEGASPTSASSPTWSARCATSPPTASLTARAPTASTPSSGPSPNSCSSPTPSLPPVGSADVVRPRAAPVIPEFRGSEISGTQSQKLTARSTRATDPSTAGCALRSTRASTCDASA